MTLQTSSELAVIEKLLAKLDEGSKQQLLDALGDERKALWHPNAGPQTDACESLADELFYGGEAGGGKSDLLMGLGVTEHENSLLLRRTNKEASKFIKRFSEIVGHRDGWNGQLQTFVLPGRIVEFGGVQLEDDKQKYKGDPHDLIGFDEIADFTETQYRFIIGWNRSANKHQRCRVVAAGNPPTTPEGLWVLKYWGAWLDPTHPRPAKQGELRWYTTINGEDAEVDGPGPHLIDGEPIIARSRTFIRSHLSDNPDLAETNYASVLAALPEELRAAYKEGRFDASLRDAPFQVIPTAWIEAAQARWTPDGYKGVMMTAMGLDPAGGGRDSAEIAARYGGWYDKIISAKGPDTADGSAMGGIVLRHRRDNCPVIVDVGGGYASGVIVRFKDNGIPYSRFDGSAGSAGVARGSGLKFLNKRAETWWRFREELDPEQQGGSAIALPPDPELKADLATPTWELTPRGIKLESKEDIRKRLGRSPGKGDAVVMALSEGNRAAARQFMTTGSMPKVITGYSGAKRR